jgi:hypothetical protein
MKIYSPQIIGTLDVDGNSTITGSLEVTAGITGSLLGTASFAQTASLAQNIVNGLSPTFNNITVTNTASFGYIQAVTGSAVYIGDSFVVVNADSPAVRYAGIAVFDSGSSPIASASLEWDSLNDTWITQEETGNTSVIITGPTGSRGSETYTTVNKLQKGLGFNYIGDSSITDDGINVVFTTPIAGTSISASSGFLGNLIGTASFATSASFAPNTTFPFTGSAVISGSLRVIGNTRTGNSNNVVNGTDSAIIGGVTNTTGVGQGLVIAGGSGNANNSLGIGTGILAGGSNTIASGVNWGTIVGGFSNTLNGNQSHIMGANSSTNNGGFSSLIAGGSSNTITTGESAVVLGGTSNSLGHSNSVIIGGTGITSTAANTVFVPNFDVSGSSTFRNNIVVTGSVSTNGVINLTGTNKWINSQAGASDTTNQAVIASSAGFTFNSAAKSSAMIASENSVVNANASQAFIIGGGTNTISQLRTGIVGGALNVATTANSYLFGAGASTINASTATTGYNVVVGGIYHQVIGSSDNSIVVGGDTNTVNNADNAAILAGTGHTNAQNRSVIIGGQNITAAAADTVYVPNFDVSGSSTFRASTVFSGSIRGEVNALSITSNTASLNCALDNFFTLTLVSGSNTFINPTNILPGQTINLRITQANPGNGTVSFPSSVKQVSGSAYVPTTGAGPVDIVTFISFDSTSLYLSNVKNLV